jgi:hypothetical protein
MIPWSVVPPECAHLSPCEMVHQNPSGCAVFVAVGLLPFFFYLLWRAR